MQVSEDVEGRGGLAGGHARCRSQHGMERRTAPSPRLLAERQPQPDAEAVLIDVIDIRKGELPTVPASTDGTPFWMSPFQTADWLLTWRNHIGRAAGHEPVTVTAYCKGEPLLVLPLAVMRRYGSRVLTWCAYAQSDYTAPLFNRALAARLDQIDGAALLRQIAGRIGGIDLVYMPKQLDRLGPAANPFVLDGALAYHVGAHAINFAPGETWEEQFKRRRSSKTRRRLKEKRAALEKLGPVSFRVAQTAAEARAIIAGCLDAKSEQLNKLGHWDPFAPPGVRSLLVDFFSTNTATSTWAVALDVGGIPAAMAFGFRDQEQWLLYQMAMPGGPAARHSPGTHMLMDLMQHCVAGGIGRLDLALGDESYKAEWCDEDLKLCISTLPLSTRGKILDLLIRLRARLRTRMASNSRLYERAKWVKGMARKIRLPF